MTRERETTTLPILPMKSAVLFPGIVAPLTVGRASSQAAVEAALAGEDKTVVLISQRDASIEFPGREDLYSLGSRGVIRKTSRQPNGMLQVWVQVLDRVALIRVEQTTPFLTGLVREAPLEDGHRAEVEALRRELEDIIARLLAVSMPQQDIDLEQLTEGADDPERFLFTVAALVSLELEKEQELLEAPSLIDAYRLLHGFLAHELKVAELRGEISRSADTEMSKEQREYFLRQQLRAIQRELGESDGEDSVVEELRQRAASAEFPETVRQEFDRELGRLASLSTASPEHNVLRSFLEFVLELPWGRPTDRAIDIARARKTLEAEHFGMEEVKERILEHLSVLGLNPDAKAPILCFVGPPGVGKTSLGASIGRALGREFQRLSLGGLHDEAELRGHRRTYVGAMPGRILQALRRAGARNPVVMLDEVDKLGRDFRGDPAAALLEILDPEQNREFRDNYLEMPFDLSQVLFVTTANSLDSIPAPLLDRMEVIRLSGYSDREKAEIARRYLVPRQLEEVGLDATQCAIDDAALSLVVSRYTREAGVRQLNRVLGKLIRKAALRIVDGGQAEVIVDVKTAREMLGSEKFQHEQLRDELPPGVASGLAWTPTGGDVLYVEASVLPQGSGMTITGQLGEVMQESARAARSYLWSRGAKYGIEPRAFKESGLHIHVPAGAIPKDGPSAGITIAAALASAFTGRSPKPETAMTGEITLSGLVLPVGGIKEKVLAAHRARMARVILPRENRRDCEELPDYVRESIEFVYVETIDEVLEAVLDGPSTPLLRVC